MDARRTAHCARLLLSGCLCTLLALASMDCAKPTISGRVLPSDSDRDGFPWQRLELLLIRGHLQQQLPLLAATHLQEALNEGRRRLLAAAQAERAAKQERLQAVDAAPSSVARSADLHSQLSVTLAELLDAERRFIDFMQPLLPRLSALGLPLARPAQLLAELQMRLQLSLGEQAVRLAGVYRRAAIAQRSAAVLSDSPARDRLCWSVENTGALAARFRDLIIRYNGSALPPDIAASVWVLPAPERALAMPRTHDLLLPGGKIEICFAARTAPLAEDLRDQYGFAHAPSRSGQWEVHWQEIELFAADAWRDTKQTPTLATLFADGLREFAASAEETQLSAAIGAAPIANEMLRAETRFLALRDLLERADRYGRAEQIIAALEANRSDEPLVEERLQSMLPDILAEPERLTRWIHRANAFISSRTVARQEKLVGAAYRFDTVPPGDYTLLARPTIQVGKPKLWMLPLHVSGKVAQDLRATSARDVTLSEAFAEVLQGEQLRCEQRVEG